MSIALLCVSIFLFAYMIYAMTRTERTYCDPADCAFCPFPHEHCSHRLGLSWDDLTKMNGQPVYIDLDGRMIPVSVYVNNVGDVYLVSEMGSMTTYDDVKRAGGIFIKKSQKTS